MDYKQILHNINPYRQIARKYIGQFLRYFKTTIPDHPKPAFWFILIGKKMLAIFLCMFVYFGLVSINFLWLFGKSPSLEQLQRPKMEQASEVYSSDSELIGKYYNENRIPVSYNEISPWVIKALVATEDVRFYEHTGIDFTALPSIFIYTLRGDNRGASTLTQQLAKNIYLNVP